jgi:membrane-associated phospholipid phosphatase
LPSSILSLVGSIEITAPIFAALLLLSRPAVRVRLIILFALVALLELQGKTMIAQPVVPDELLRYVFTFGTPTGGIGTAFSFPSGHSARTSFLIAMGIALVAQSNASPARKRVLIALLLVVAAAMLVSRVYIGDHWMTDVIGGALIGVGLALFAVPGE